MLQIFLHIVSYDIWFYFSHLLLHKYLWWIHRIHHEKREPIWIDTYHGHWFESVFQSLGFFLPLIFLNVSTSSGIALVYINIRAMLHHDRRGSWIVGDYHLIHHKHPTINYGQPYLDFLFGTNSQFKNGNLMKMELTI